MAAPFLPTPSVRRATLNGRRHQPVVLISTHALREEGDVSKQTKLGQATISTHALREEGDKSNTHAHTGTLAFLPTPSARRATLCFLVFNILHGNFYPHPPRGGRPAPCSGPARPAHFYPHPPRGGRREGRRCIRRLPHISTHTLREEGDAPRADLLLSTCYFYPHPPRGGRHKTKSKLLL